jgi:hypothetical protein
LVEITRIRWTFSHIAKTKGNGKIRKLRKIGIVAMTERDGKFLFKDLEPGPYMLRVARGGYAAQEYGQKTPQSSGTVITLTPGQQMKDVAFRMIAAGTVTGRVGDTT